MEHIARNRTHFSDPFGRDPPPKAFYHPSKQKHLKKKEREITLSPNRHDARAAKPHSPGEELFLKGTNAFSIRTPPNKDQSDDHSSQFDETWPSSERPSCTSVIDSDSASPASGRPSDMMDSLAYLKSTLDRSEIHDYTAMRGVTAKSESREAGSSTGSVLQSYIERFRHGAPMSREERSRTDHSGKPEFWWLSQHPPTPSDTSTPKDDDKPRSRQFTHQGKRNVTSTDQSGTLPLTARTLRALAIDEKTHKLQERADRLLEESNSSLHSSEPAVSTDGLGASSHGTVSSFEEIPYRPCFTRTLDPSPNTTEPRFPVRHGVKPGVSVPRGPLKPAEDILYQWRLRRKMEVAQQGQVSGVKATGSCPTKDLDSKLDAFRRRLDGTVSPATGVRSSAALNFTPAPLANADKKVDAEVQTRESLEAGDSKSNKNIRTPPRSRKSSKPEIASPTLARHKLSPRNIDPHLHLMCDLLPCPHAEKYSEKFSNLYQTSSDFSETDGSSPRPNHVQYKQYLRAEKPHSEEKRSKRKENTGMSRHDRELDETVKRDDLSHADDDSSNARTDGVTEQSDTAPSDREEQADVMEVRQLRQSSGKKSDRKQVRIAEEGDFDKRRLAKERWKRDDSVNERRGRDGQSDRRDFKGRQSDEPHEIESREKMVMKTPASSKKGVPGPVHSSSPARQPQSVSLAVGQTVSEHLFDGSAGAVISSVDSWASLTDNTPICPSQPVRPPPVSQSQDDRDGRTPRPDDQDDTEESCESDGEFPDDHILKMLRHQRGEYEIKLRQIDDLLQQSSFGQK